MADVQVIIKAMNDLMLAVPQTEANQPGAVEIRANAGVIPGIFAEKLDKMSHVTKLTPKFHFLKQGVEEYVRATNKAGVRQTFDIAYKEWNDWK